MHDDRELIEKRIQRELWSRVLTHVYSDRQELAIKAGPDLATLEPFNAGSPWGVPWGTTWFEFSGDVPPSWVDRRVEAVIDLGFNPDSAGFQCEGLVVNLAEGGVITPQQGIHPRRTRYRLDPVAGPLVLNLEAASNPSFPQFQRSALGSPETAGDIPQYRFREAALVVVDSEYEALAFDIEVLDATMLALRLDDPRRARIRQALVAALDSSDKPEVARRVLAPMLAAQPAGSNAHHVVGIGHAHIDTAWLWPTRETKRKCTRTFASAVALMDDYPEYKFACSSAQHYVWIEEEHPELFAKIIERAERGQWIPVGGMWVEADMNLPSGESLVRQIVFGQRYFEETFGERCTEVWIPDVFGYPAGLPQVFAAGGMTRFLTQKLSWNKQNKFPHSTFLWEGIDGTQVLTHFPPVDTYNAEVTPGQVAYSVSKFREHAWSSNSLMPFGHGDGGGGPTREMLERAHRMASLDPLATLEIGSPDHFFSRVEAEINAGAPVPVWRGELYFETHRGTLTSQLKTKLGNRRCERLLVETELWAATLGRPADVDDLWKQVLTQQFHDILPGSSIAWVHQDAEEVFAAVEAELEQRIAALLAEVVPASSQEGALWLANPADVPIESVVVLNPETAAQISAAESSGPTQVLADGRVAAHISIPALGVGPADPQPMDDHVQVSDSSMINRHLALRWDSSGNITSLIDLRQARELVAAGEYCAFLEIAPDHPVEYDAWDLESWTRRGARPLTARTPPGDSPDGVVMVAVEDEGPLVGRVKVSRTFGPSSSVVTYELHAGSRQLLVHVELDWHHDEHLLSIAFPLDVRADLASCDVQFGVAQRPTHPSSPWDAAKFEVCAHRYADLSEPDFGVAVLNNGRYGHALFDGAIRVSLARAAKYPDPEADHGHHEVSFAILPHEAGLAQVRAAASLFNSSLREVVGEARAAAIPVVSVVADNGANPSGIEIDAVKLADDGSGDLIVRLHEACGNRVRCSVRSSLRVAAAWRCNLLEEPSVGEEVGDGIVTLTLRPFQLLTLRMQLRSGSDGRFLSD